MDTQTTAIDVCEGNPVNAPVTHDGANPFSFLHPPSTLASLVDGKNLHALVHMGGIDAIVNGLGSDRNLGLTVQNLHQTPVLNTVTPFNASLQSRRAVYGSNALPRRKHKSLYQHTWSAFKDNLFRSLCIAAVTSLALGLYSDFGLMHRLVWCSGNGEALCRKPRVVWAEGVAILVGAVIIVMIGSVSDWQKDRQFRALNDKMEDRTVKAVRDGMECTVNTKDLVVGDVIVLRPGDIIPCDGLLLQGQHVRCEEPSTNDAVDAIEKIPYEQSIQEMDPTNAVARHDRNCFLVSETKVLEGHGKYIVTAVGTNSSDGHNRMNGHSTSLMQQQINALAENIAKLGLLISLVLFATLMAKFCADFAKHPDRPKIECALDFVRILVISATLIVVAVPAGLPLAIMLALAFATKKMMAEKLLVRNLGSCQAIANITVVCTDKTGTLTQNVMSVVATSVGVDAKFAQQPDQYPPRADINNRRSQEQDIFEMAKINDILHPPLRTLFNQVICITSTASWSKCPASGNWAFTGPQTEAAFLRFAKELGWDDYKTTRDNAQVLETIPFSSQRKWTGVVIRTLEGKARLLITGASEVLSAQCNRYVLIKHPGTKTSETGGIQTIHTKDIDPETRRSIENTIVDYGVQLLRPIGICYRDLTSWPPLHSQSMDEVNGLGVSFDNLLEDLTLVSIVAIEDPLRPGVQMAVDSCSRAGVNVKLCTGDYLGTARYTAVQCGIRISDSVLMEGPTFRALSYDKKLEIAPRLQVLARASPEDKRVFVETLKARGEVVCVAGADDSPALKAAHVGLSMGSAGTEVAKQASDITLMSGDFASVVSALMWGRCINDAVRKFLQFQMTGIIAAVLITFTSAIASNKDEPALTAVQLLWISLIMDAFSTLALVTDPASIDALNRKPDPKPSSLFNTDMIKQIIIQSFFQTATTLLFHFYGNHILSFDVTGKSDGEINQWRAELGTLVFNAFVFCQIFNLLNCRSINQTKNVFGGLLSNNYFVVIVVFEVAMQILIIFVGGAVFSANRMSLRSWGVSIAIGFTSLPLGFLIRLVPNPLIEKCLIVAKLLPDPRSFPTTSPEYQDQNTGSSSCSEGLLWFGRIRGGRLQGLDSM